MRKLTIILFSFFVCLFMASQVLAHQTLSGARQPDSPAAQDKVLPGVLMLLLGDPDKHGLTINITGQGKGQVHVSPSGEEFDPGTVVTLTAEADLGYVFSGWGGACSGTQLSCTVTMSQARTVSADFVVESTVPRANQAVLGPLAGATIRAYRLSNLTRPIEGPFLANNSLNILAAGSFDLSLSGISNNEWILVTATGGWDIDANDDGIIDQNPVRNHGTIHALAKASQWRQGGLKVNALTDMAWRYSRAWVGQTSVGELEKRLNDVAQHILLEKISGQGEIGYSDLLAFIPHNAGHKAKLSFDYARVLASGGFTSQVHAGRNEEELRAALNGIFGAHLSFALPDNLESEVLVRLSAFGRGQVASTDNKLVVDSEASASAQKLQAPYTRDGDPVLFTATPIAETEILGWAGCDWVSEDQTQCRIGLASNRQVQVDFGYKEVQVSPQFVDLSRATVVRSGNTLTVTVDESDAELLNQMADIAADWFVAGLAAGQNPFLLRVTAVLSHEDNVWQLSTTQASLEDVIQQGTGTLQRAMTHGDLAPDAYMARTFSEAGEIHPVRLLPSRDPNDRVFRLQIGDTDQVKSTKDEDERSGEFCLPDDEQQDICLVGEVKIEIDLDTGVSYRLLTGLEYFKFVPEIKMTPYISLTGKSTLEVKDKVKLLPIPFKPIPFMIGPIPVFVTPRVDIYLGIEGKAEAVLTMGVSYSMTVRGGIQYSNGQWEEIKGFERGWKLDDPEIEGKAKLEGYLSAEAVMLVYNLTGPGVELRSYLKAEGKAGLDRDCVLAVDWGVYAGLRGNLIWRGNKDFPVIGKELTKLDAEFTIFDWYLKILGGVWNGCGPMPPTLYIDGDDIHRVIIQGASTALQTSYTLRNGGDVVDMPWTIQSSSNQVSVQPSSGNLAPGTTVDVVVTIQNSAALGVGAHEYRLDFKNDYSSGIVGQSNLGSSERFQFVTVIPELFPAPTITSARRHTATTASLQWTYPVNSAHLLAGFDIWYTTDSSLETGWTKIGTATRTQRSISLLGVPQQTFYVTVEAFGADPSVQTAQAEARTVRMLGDEPDPGDTWTDPVTGMEFVWVPGGCYDMGCGAWTDSCSSNESPVHEVCLDGFWMGKYEVTQGQWTQIMGSNPSHFKSGDNYPVESVSWNDVQGFMTALNAEGSSTFRLPTEAEWEYAARSGGREEKYAGGDDLDSLGWYSGNSGRRTHEVGTKAANGLGIYDMSGNVWEWVSDWYGTYYYSVSPRDNPQGPETGSIRVFRGGSWGSSARSCRAAFRGSNWPDRRSYYLGFRLALSPGQQ